MAKITTRSIVLIILALALGIVLIGVVMTLRGAILK